MTLKYCITLLEHFPLRLLVYLWLLEYLKVERRQSLQFSGSSWWSQLPVWIQDTENLSAFNIRLKTFHFDKACRII